jgi:hypothetical protein
MEKKNGSDPSRNSGRNMPPPVYRPVPSASQQKIASPATPARSGAPPVYRPFASTSQRKPASASPVYRPGAPASQQKTTPLAAPARSGAPPVYRPFTATSQLNSAGAPQVYRPFIQASQQKTARAQPGRTPTAANSLQRKPGIAPLLTPPLTRRWVQAGATLQLSNKNKKGKGKKDSGSGKKDDASAKRKLGQREFEAAQRSASDVRLMTQAADRLPPLSDTDDVDTRCANLVAGGHPIAGITFASYDNYYLEFVLTTLDMGGHIRFFGSPKSGEVTILDTNIGKVGYVYMYDAKENDFVMPGGGGTIATMPTRYSPARQALNYIYAGQ